MREMKVVLSIHFYVCPSIYLLVGMYVNVLQFEFIQAYNLF